LARICPDDLLANVAHRGMGFSPGVGIAGLENESSHSVPITTSRATLAIDGRLKDG
jgi:hypothetical protein